jgi:hypothetical protein
VAIPEHVYDNTRMSEGDPRSIRTMTAVQNAAVRLLETAGWDSVHVKGICQCAGISRSTFYQHFQEPWQPITRHLQEAFAREFPSVLDGTAHLEPEELLLSGKPLSYPLFVHMESCRSIYVPVFADLRGGMIRQHLIEQITQLSRAHHEPLRRISPHRVDADLVARYLAGGLVAAAGWWILQEPRDTPAAMAYWFSRIAAPGLLQTMGLDSLLAE